MLPDWNHSILPQLSEAVHGLRYKKYVDCCFDHYFVTSVANYPYLPVQCSLLECWVLYVLNDPELGSSHMTYTCPSKVNIHVAYCFHELVYPLETQVFLILQFHLLESQWCSYFDSYLVKVY